MTMTMTSLKAVKRMIERIVGSTHRTIQTENDLFEYDGLQRLGTSNQEFNFSHNRGHEIPHTVIIRSRIGNAYSDRIQTQEKVLVLTKIARVRFEGLGISLPPEVIEDLFIWPAENEFRGEVFAIVPDLFSGYDEDGRPRFDGDKQLSITILNNGREEKKEIWAPKEESQEQSRGAEIIAIDDKH